MTPTQASFGRPRVCAVSYLNTVPLVWGMLHGEQRNLFELEFRLPAECAERLASGAADIGIVPSVELPRMNLELIPGAGIACRGAVRSILLLSKVPPGQIRTLAADTSSRTSTALSQIVLARRYRAEPRILPMAPDLAAMLGAADAAMIIGDPALRLSAASLPFHSLDLGEEWVAFTGLPMVFAAWAGRPGYGGPDVARAFRDSCAFGLAHLDEIVEAEAAPRGLTARLACDYLRRNIVFELGEREYAGLSLFHQYAAEFAVAETAGRVSS